MVTLSDALVLAQAHTEEMNTQAPIHPNYQYGMSKPVEYAHCWYFDYRIQPRLDFPPSKQEMFAGAPGFIISKQTTKLCTVSWHEMQQLAAQSAIWQQVDLQATQLLKTDLNLATLRAHLPLTLPELIVFKKDLNELGTDVLAKEQVLKSKLLQAAGFIDV